MTITSIITSREKKKVCRTSALKVLNFAMGGEEGYENCNKYVDILGLPVIFPFFMKTPNPHKKAGPNKHEIEGSFFVTLIFILWYYFYFLHILSF